MASCSEVSGCSENLRQEARSFKASANTTGVTGGGKDSGSETVIAAALGISQGSVKSHAHHALRMLERLVTAEADADLDVESKGGQP